MHDHDGDKLIKMKMMRFMSMITMDLTLMGMAMVMLKKMEAILMMSSTTIRMRTRKQCVTVIDVHADHDVH